VTPIRFLTVSLIACSLYAQETAKQEAAKPATPLTPQKIQDIAAGVVQSHMTWGPELNSPGATLAVKETSREGGTVTFSLRASGLPKDRVYVLFQWPVTQMKPVPALRGVTFDADGVAICAGRTGTCGNLEKPNDPIELTAIPALGEPYRFAVAAQDDPAIKAYVKVVPMPIESVDKACHLRGVVLMPHGILVGVEAVGYPPDSAIDFHTDSEGEIHDSKPKTDNTGRYVTAVLPVKAGVYAGNVHIRAAAANCAPEISVPWSAPVAPAPVTPAPPPE
jgi:hypothetical protein